MNSIKWRHWIKWTMKTVKCWINPLTLHWMDLPASFSIQNMKIWNRYKEIDCTPIFRMINGVLCMCSLLFCSNKKQQNNRSQGTHFEVLLCSSWQEHPSRSRCLWWTWGRESQNGWRVHLREWLTVDQCQERILHEEELLGTGPWGGGWTRDVGDSEGSYFLLVLGNM